MTRVLQGSKYLDTSERPNLPRALANASETRISFFDDYNAGIQRSFDALGVPVDLSRNYRAERGKPDAIGDKRDLGPLCNAPQKVIDFVTEHNQTDIRLYATLRARALEA